jgi:hypothetical protein
VPSIIREVPYFDQPTRVQVRGRTVSAKRDQIVHLPLGPPFLLELLPGIAVYPAKEGQPLYPRLPLLGLRAFRRAGLQIAIDCRRACVTIHTPRRFGLFA